MVFVRCSDAKFSLLANIHVANVVMMPLALPLLYSALARLTNFTSPLLTLLRNNWQPREPWGAPCATRKFGKHLLFGADDGNGAHCGPTLPCVAARRARL